MSLTATRTNNPTNTIFLQDVLTGFAGNTRGYATLQQLVGNGYIQFGFDQNTADRVSAAAGISYAVYPHAARNSMSAMHLIAYGFCVRSHLDTNRLFIKLPGNNSFVDTGVDYAPNIRMRVERIGDTVNFYTIVGTTVTLRHSVNSATPLPNTSDFAILSGRNGCRIVEVLISGVTQLPTPLDLTKNVYIPLHGYLNFSPTQPRLAVSMGNNEDFTWHFPDGTTSKDAAPNKNLDLVNHARLVRLEVPSGVAAIRNLTLPILTRGNIAQRYTPPDLSQLTELRNLKFITGFPLIAVTGVPEEKRQILFTSQLRLPNSIQNISHEIIEEEVAARTAIGFTSTGLDLFPLLFPGTLDFSNLSNLITLEFGFTEDNATNPLFQSNFRAFNKFPNLAGCTKLTSLFIRTFEQLTNNNYPNKPNGTAINFFGDSVPFSFLSSLSNIESLTVTHEASTAVYDPIFINSLLVGMSRVVDTRTNATRMTLSFRRSNGVTETATGSILNFATNAAAGANSIQLTATTGLNVGDRLLLEDGAANNLNNNLVIASITGAASPFTVTFQTGQTLQNAYTAATGRVLNLESGIGATRRMRLQGHTIQVNPATI